MSPRHASLSAASISCTSSALSVCTLATNDGLAKTFYGIPDDKNKQRDREEREKEKRKEEELRGFIYGSMSHKSAIEQCLAGTYCKVEKKTAAASSR